MPTRHEAILAGLATALAGTGLQTSRESPLPAECPPEGLANLAPGDPVEAGIRLGAPIREWTRQVEIELVVTAIDPEVRVALLDGATVAIAGALYGATLGGLVDHLQIDAPIDADEIPMKGTATLKGAVIPVTLFYETSDNPMENQS